ncbi:ALG11 alpha-1,2-mannosyltransferase [Oratosquilla oratoria]|uniref:ALG11 alpha-1,2-mannosyltransferase n=1 Tax=Oratosquilla oratoria TaxID=337810 RepID=UPI003F75DA5E
MWVFNELALLIREVSDVTADSVTLMGRLYGLLAKLIMVEMVLLVLLLGLLLLTWTLLKWAVRCVRRGESGYVHVAFFHPYCHAGGGGERVLWCAIRALQRRYPRVKCYIYSGETTATPEEILARAQQRFNVVLQQEVEFIPIRTRTLLEARHYPFLTLLMQSLGSVVVAAEALSKFNPDVMIDTTGYAFIYPIFHYVASCRVACYVHYPTISTDMLSVVNEQTEAHNNRGVIARSRGLSLLKLGYYHVFAFLYSLVGSCASVVLVNSSWTRDHITKIWGRPGLTHIVYPPCDTERFKNMPLVPDDEKEVKTIVSIGQFRPEKDHPLQLRSFAKLLGLLDSTQKEKVRLVLLGGCRNEEDQRRVEDLRRLASEIGVDGQVDWKLNVPFADLLETVQKGLIGLHAMWNEHFGICVVECMAGGLVMVAHDSGGPKMDIVVDNDGQRTGYLASDEESYAQAMKEVLEATDFERSVIREAARASVDRFSEAKFEDVFLQACDFLVTR